MVSVPDGGGGFDVQVLIEQVLAEGGRDNFVPGWLKARDVAWATDLIPHLAELEASK